MASESGPTRVLGEPRPSGASLPAGATVGEWTVVRHLATGGFGTVYEVTHRGGRRGALKVLHTHMLASPEMVARMVREANVIARLRHPNVVELLDASVDPRGQPYLVMEYLEGRDLAGHLAERGRFAPAETLAILTPLCAAVAIAHEHGVIHRDIKASNVFLCEEPDQQRVVLLDFGIAKLLDVGAADLTASRQALGTPASMAPEQIRGEAVDGRTDVYALGALAYHLLTGKMPFDDASMTMSQYLHLHAARPRPSALAPLAPAIDDVVVKAMAVDPQRRHGDPLAFLAALRTAVTGAGATEQRVVDGVAIRVGAVVRGDAADEATIDAIDALLSTADAEMAARGFGFVRDLGDASLFFAAAADDAAAIDAARAVAKAVAARLEPDARVTAAIWIHRAQTPVVDGQLGGGPLADPSSWGLPEDGDGIWITAALTAAGVRGPRRID